MKREGESFISKSPIKKVKVENYSFDRLEQLFHKLNEEKLPENRCKVGQVTALPFFYTLQNDFSIFLDFGYSLGSKISNSTRKHIVLRSPITIYFQKSFFQND
jgi:hypothetical protein